MDGRVLDGIAQEVDIETGEVLFEWHSLDHVGVEESYYRAVAGSRAGRFDYFHINSIDPYPDGYLTISARRTSTVYKVDRTTGEVVWRLGGKNSDFEMGPGTRTDWQHDARRHPDNIITIFDNGRVPGRAVPRDRGRGRRRCHEGDAGGRIHASRRRYWPLTQGNVQVLPDGQRVRRMGQRAVLLRVFPTTASCSSTPASPGGGVLQGLPLPLEGRAANQASGRRRIRRWR